MTRRGRTISSESLIKPPLALGRRLFQRGSENLKDGSARSYDDVAKAAHAWALEHIPFMYHFGPEDLEITLLKEPEFGKVRLA